MQLDEINWGMIGTGNVTEIKSGPAFNRVPHSRLVKVMGRDPAKAADYAARHGVPAWCADVNELINDPAVNAVYIATPPDVHLDYTRRALLAGKPVYVEKPMARSAAECWEMNRVSRQTRVPLFVAYYRRALPYFLKLKQLVDSRVIGDIRCVNIRLHHPPYEEETGPAANPRWRVFPAVSGGGHFHDLASHQFDFLEYVFGPMKQASGLSRNLAGLYPADDQVAAMFEFESGVIGTGSWSFTVNAEQKTDETQIIGATGRITFSFFNSFVITVETENKTETFELPYPPHVQEPLIRCIVDELRGEGKSPSNGFSGARASLILDQITQDRRSVSSGL